MTILPARLGGLLLGVAGLCLVAIPARADTYLSGTYNCSTIEVAGKITPCTAPSIELKADGSYQVLSERGTYEIVQRHWLILSTSKNHGRARLDGTSVIVFEFTSSGKRSRITYRRKFERRRGWFES